MCTIHLPKIGTRFLCLAFAVSFCQPTLPLARLILDNSGTDSKLWVEHPNAVLPHLPGGLQAPGVPDRVSNWEAGFLAYLPSSVQ